MTSLLRADRRSAKAVLLAGVVAILLPAAAAGAETPPPIAIEGNRRIDAETIRGYFRPDPAGRLSDSAVDDGLKALYASGLFTDLKIDRRNGRIVVTVVEAPVIDRVAFEGNARIKDAQLSAELQSRAREPITRPKVQADVQRIVELYRRAGRYDVRVTPKTIERPGSRVDLVFEIAEGAKTAVKDIRFAGNKAFPAGQLQDVIKTSRSSILSFFKGNDTYDPDRMEVDRDLLRRFYLGKGYADVEIVSASGAYDMARKGFVVTFTIVEGPLYHFGAIDLRSSLRAVDPGNLRSAAKTASGAVFNADAVVASAEDMTLALSRAGHAFARVRPSFARNAAARTIDVTYVVEGGPRVYVERINIRGNSSTRDEVIRREFDIAEGDAFDKVLLDRAERQLRKLGFFKTVRFTNEPGSAPDRVVVNVDLEEQQTGDFNVSGGYSTEDGFLAEVSVSERNLFGRGIYARVKVTYGESAKGLDLSFVQPYVLGSRMAAGLDIFANQTAVTENRTFGSETYGATARLIVPMTPDLSSEWRYSLFSQRLTLDPALADCTAANSAAGCLANGEASVALKQAVADGATLVSVVGNTQTYDTLNNKKNPTRGVRAELKQDFAGLGGDARFFKTTGDLRYFHEVGGDMVGMVRLQGGYVTPFGGQPLPLLNGFFGGPQLVRGFAANGIGPRDAATLDNIGGSRFFATTAELQSPIPGMPTEFGLKVAVFADAGSVFGFKGQTVFPGSTQALKVADSKTIRSSMGAGLVWQSPFGNLRVDYAFPLTKAATDVTQPFSFSASPF
jgi:outer membrane protein insertion porin family